MEPSVTSVNIARPATLVLGSKEVPTGIFKEPVDGRVAVAELGLEGDVQVDKRVHGGPAKAVYAYALEDIEWWEHELLRDLGPGFFGENLTVQGIDVTGSRPGDVWEVGSVVLEATQPREPCWKLATKVGDPLFPKHFTAAGRPGWYLRVLQPGHVGAGDAVRVSPSPRSQPAR